MFITLPENVHSQSQSLRIILIHPSFVFQGPVAHWHYLHSAVHSWRLCEISWRFCLNKHFTDVVSIHLPLDRAHPFLFDAKA